MATRHGDDVDAQGSGQYERGNGNPHVPLRSRCSSGNVDGGVGFHSDDQGTSCSEHTRWIINRDCAAGEQTIPPKRDIIPLSAPAVARIGAMLEPFAFDVIYGAFFDRVIPRGGKDAGEAPGCTLYRHRHR